MRRWFHWDTPQVRPLLHEKMGAAGAACREGTCALCAGAACEAHGTLWANLAASVFCVEPAGGALPSCIPLGPIQI